MSAMWGLRPSCKEAAALLVARADRPLGLAQRAGLYFHLLACKACPRFARQLLTTQNAMKQWRNYQGD